MLFKQQMCQKLSPVYHNNVSADWIMQDRARGQALIARVENTFNMCFENGRNPDINFMAHLWEPLRWIHTPLVLYMAAEAIWAATGVLLRVLGFRPFTHPMVCTRTVSECACVYKFKVGRVCSSPADKAHQAEGIRCLRTLQCSCSDGRGVTVQQGQRKYRVNKLMSMSVGHPVLDMVSPCLQRDSSRGPVHFDQHCPRHKQQAPPQAGAPHGIRSACLPAQ